MKTVVYADILIIINFLMNYLLLRADAILTGFGFKSVRLLISSFVGSLFSLIIFIENIPSSINTIIKIIYMVIMLLIAFRFKSLKIFIRHFLTFFAVNMIFAGIMLAMNIFLFPNTSLFNNGIVYFDIDIITLTIISVICYLFIYIFNVVIHNKTPHGCIYSIKIIYNGKSVEGKALYDSGNTLCDCFSGKPVVIADEKFIKKLTENDKLENMKNYRLIPFSTISGNGTIPAFMADCVEIYVSGNKYNVENVYIGLTENKIISGDYSALLGSPFFDLISDNKLKLQGGEYEKKR